MISQKKHYICTKILFMNIKINGNYKLNQSLFEQLTINHDFQSGQSNLIFSKSRFSNSATRRFRKTSSFSYLEHISDILNLKK